jgi:hypothetical protein
MKRQDLSVRRRREFFLPAAIAVSLLMAGCSSSNSSGPAAATVFGDEMSLAGSTTQAKDGHTELELRWKALRKPSADYIVFVHALDSSGGIAFQGDHPLKNAAGQPTSSWAAGEAVIDRFPMTPPPGHPAGAYPLRIGLYANAPMRVLQLTRAALPVPADDWKDKSILLAQVDCR